MRVIFLHPVLHIMVMTRQVVVNIVLLQHRQDTLSHRVVARIASTRNTRVVTYTKQPFRWGWKIVFFFFMGSFLPSIFYIATLSSIFDSQLSLESGKLQLARWSHNVFLDAHTGNFLDIGFNSDR